MKSVFIWRLGNFSLPMIYVQIFYMVLADGSRVTGTPSLLVFRVDANLQYRWRWGVGWLMVQSKKFIISLHLCYVWAYFRNLIRVMMVWLKSYSLWFPIPNQKPKWINQHFIDASNLALTDYSVETFYLGFPCSVPICHCRLLLNR